MADGKTKPNGTTAAARSAAAAADYVELHARSAFSFHHGASHPEDMVRRAAELGMPALALLDRDGVYGSARAHYAAAELRQEQGVEIRPLTGAEVTLEGEIALPLLVRTREGYQNLCRLITRAKLRGLPPETARAHPFLNPRKDGRVRWEELEEFSEGLIALTGDEEGPLRQALAGGNKALAEERLRFLLRTYGSDGVAVELQRHRVRGEDWANRCLVDLAAARRLPLIATNGAGFARKQGRLLFDAFACLRHHTPLDAAGTLLAPNAERYLKSARQMAELFADHPEALTNTRRLADRVEFTLENLGYRFPDYPVPDGVTVPGFLREEVYKGAKGRYGKITKKVRKQLDHELTLIEKLGFCGYFLIVWDIVNFARAHHILVQGRGSAANSAVCYCLGITAVDAIKQKLLFERFLSEGRNSWPDIDLDLPSGDRREAVIQGVFEKYQPLGAAMTANVITYRGRSAMREMGKVLGIPEDTLGRFSSSWGSARIQNAEELRVLIRESGLAEQHPRLPALVHLYQSVYGLPRHLGQHSGGMIISDRPLDSVVPLENATMENRRVVQWDKDDCEDLGIIKVDLLGIGMLAAMQDTAELCRERGRPIDLADLPADDPATFEMLRRADTIGVFQVESRAQMATLPRMKPDTFYDLVVEVAIIRPGPIVGNMVHPYLNRRAGREKIDYIDDRFRPALERTLGIPLFQEQVLQMAMIAADFNGSEAEALRRAISFHRSEERMSKVMIKLRSAMERKGVPRETQERIVSSIQSFALYGFPESHAISFALLAYASAWLKVHRAAEFYVGLMNNQPMGFYSRATLVKDAKDHGLRVRTVDVTLSAALCTVEDDRTVRLGLMEVSGLSPATAERIVTERAARPFASLEDFMIRARPKRDERRVLAKVGALNPLRNATHRREALWKVEKPFDPEDLFAWRAAQESVSPEEGEENETATTAATADPSSSSPLAPMDRLERLQADFDGLALTTGPHPMAYIRDRLPPGISRACDLIHGKMNQPVTIAGLVICRQRPSTAKGHVFVSLEDETGVANAFVHETLFQKYRHVIPHEAFLMIRGRLQIQHGVTSVYALHAEGLPFETVAVGEQSHDFR